MIVLEDVPETPSNQQATTPYSRHNQLRRSYRLQSAEDLEQRGLPDSRATVHRARWQTSASNDSVIGRSMSGRTAAEKTKILRTHSKVAVSVLLTLATITVTGVISVSSEADVSANPEIVNEVSPSAIDAIADELLASRRQANDYLEEINWLHSHTSWLQQRVDDLDNETLSLNHELLQLELTVASLKAEAKPPIKVQTVYNFVNVPIGHAVEEVYYAPPDIENYQHLAGSEPTSLQLEGQKESDELYERGLYRDYDEESQRIDLSHNNPQDPFLNDGHIPDPETGYYIEE